MDTSICVVKTYQATKQVDSLDVTLSKAIGAASFTTADLQLTHDGAAVPLTSAVTITPLGNNVWHIAGLSGFDAAAGAYMFTVDATNLVDTVGNAGVGVSPPSWAEVTSVTTGLISGARS